MCVCPLTGLHTGTGDRGAAPTAAAEAGEWEPRSARYLRGTFLCSRCPFPAGQSAPSFYETGPCDWPALLLPAGEGERHKHAPARTPGARSHSRLVPRTDQRRLLHPRKQAALPKAHTALPHTHTAPRTHALHPHTPQPPHRHCTLTLRTRTEPLALQPAVYTEPPCCSQIQIVFPISIILHNI